MPTWHLVDEPDPADLLLLGANRSASNAITSSAVSADRATMNAFGASPASSSQAADDRGVADPWMRQQDRLQLGRGDLTLLYL